jgi:lysozyme
MDDIRDPRNPNNPESIDDQRQADVRQDAGYHRPSHSAQSAAERSRARIAAQQRARTSGHPDTPAGTTLRTSASSRAGASPRGRVRPAAPASGASQLSSLRETAERAVGENGPRYALIAVLIAGILALLVIFSAISSCTNRSAENGSNEQTGQTTDAGMYSLQYDWNNLTTDNNRYAYVVDGNQVSRLGIDVSESNGAIDWEAVAADGVEFAIVRVGYRGDSEGEIYTDANFDANIDGAIAAGLDVGVYFYSQATNEDEAREEAERCLYEINKRDLQYPVIYDFEKTTSDDGRANGLSSTQATLNAAAFCQVIKEGGYETMIYGNQQDLANYNPVLLTAFPTWYAEYGSMPTSNYEFTMWQYTNQGSVAGIETNVDMNIDLANAPAVQATAEQG